MRSRTLSLEDPVKAETLRRRLQKDVRLFPLQPPFLYTLAVYTLLLPYTGGTNAHAMLYANLSDQHHQRDLENMKVINWHPRYIRMLALSTKGDGNCLLHAVALSMWGVHDRDTTLRGLLHTALKHDKGQGRFFKRYRAEKTRELRQETYESVQLESLDWQDEWHHVMKATESPQGSPTSDYTRTNVNYPFLEAIHIFVLANVLRRPVIVLSPNHIHSLGGALMAQNYMQGIYIPLLWNASECFKTPVIIGYHMSHFSALVPQESSPEVEALQAVPLVRADAVPLPLHFLTDEEQTRHQTLLHNYMDVMDVPIPAAKLTLQSLPPEFDMVSPTTEGATSAGIDTRPSPSAPPKELDEFDSVTFSALQDTGEKAPSVVGSTLNQLSNPVSMPGRSDEERERYLSFTDSHCGIDDCRYYASAHTYPFCHEHALVQKPPTSNVQTNVPSTASQYIPTSPTSNIQSMPSITSHIPYSPTSNVQTNVPSITPQHTLPPEEKCSRVGCQFYTTRETYPYCYAHKDYSVSSSFTPEKCAVAACPLLTTTECYPFCSNHGVREGSGDQLAHSMQRMLSVRDEMCAVSGCQYHASENTFPYCHEHSDNNLTREVKIGRTTYTGPSRATYSGPSSAALRYREREMLAGPSTLNSVLRATEHSCHLHETQIPQEEPLLSVVESKCPVHQCTFYASHHTYPYCHEHNPSETSRNRLLSPNSIQSSGNSSGEAERFPSITGSPCAYPGCEFYSSENTYPYCYTHVEQHSSGRLRSMGERHSWNGTFPQKSPQRQMSTADDTSPRPCIVAQCPFMGFSTMSGMCPTHYEQIVEPRTPDQRQRGKSSKEGKRNEEVYGLSGCEYNASECNSSPSHECHLHSGRMCIYPGCKETGLNVNGGLCWGCFERKVLIQSRQPLRLKVQYSSTLGASPTPPPRNKSKRSSEKTPSAKPPRPQIQRACSVREQPLHRKSEDAQVSVQRAKRKSLTLPRCSESGSLEKEENVGNFRKTMQEVENKSRSAVAKCRNGFCDNYGNFSKGGLCNQCYQLQQRFS